MENWTKEKLQELIGPALRGRKFIVVSNREPYMHVHAEGRVKCIKPAGGLTTAIDPMLRASGGVWVAHGSGSADSEVVDRSNRVQVPPESPSYTLRRVWLTEDLERDYYCGLANEGLWPLCHAAFQRPRFSLKDWKSYQRANRIFAEAVLKEAGGDPACVFIQDYHLGLLPRMLKERNPNLLIGQFWHIPWPNPETFRAFPWKEELLDGLLGNDLLGFHVRQYCSNFLESVDRAIEARVENELGYVTHAGELTSVRPFPISIDFAEQVRLAASAKVTAAATAWVKELGKAPELLGIGIDRVDYTKGIPERLHALDHLLEQHPGYIGRLSFLQVGAPSRTAIGSYECLNRSLREQVDHLNRKWGRRDWKPVIFVQRHVDQADLVALHLMADFCLVNSLHDGMNLVAKEFVASRIDGDGVLILSEFTGASEELTDALLVNPFSADEVAAAMHAALEMPAVERRRRMNRMRAVVSGNNVYRWAVNRPDPCEAGCRGRRVRCHGWSRMIWHGLSDIGNITSQLGSARRILIATDFDGTLCPICPNPDAVEIAPAILDVLRQMTASKRFEIAVISGRALADVSTRVPVDVTFAGNHGLEIAGGGIAFEHPVARGLRTRLTEACRELQQALSAWRGAWVEDKGLTATVHYRQLDPEQLDSLLLAVAEFKQKLGGSFTLHHAHKALEICPAVPWNKGYALKYIRQQTGPYDACISLGDDRTDELMFRCNRDGWNVRIGDFNQTSATHCLASPSEVASFLWQILAKLSPRRAVQSAGISPGRLTCQLPRH